MPKSQLPDSEWITPAEAAAALGVTTKTVSRLSDSGKVRAIRPGGTQRRYATADIEAILSQGPWDAA
ncbi:MULTISPECIES: helix-turn-helix domain-containing protein [unclassified Microbacterium]|uniref:helix-turn-helix domain-containing protein n=1 Tax=unclassified Microbacterium TaxID=2609290 RepID=UPI000CFC4D5C|nr:MULTISPECIES: helix-turn-helix domain-containing protein [unclassified Microbacterium]PQZ60671.1 MerR family DNA-binding transcriptional regulator [Microbacterium sp. MYb43]PQZ82097.1 MerR family DNA-binding transcriptional regulator [Microbacterium sp. MYb40]PRB22359.1 MerR family DNA-binding transcriptional regulator [Microbacterium sp. MYb54]PRB31077.1 MerR family DNA-binding transcriptional regulator [Microbacterium sp. MYb50]PRB69687.1 MerR family DNA-binding transcriptional regulator 